VRGAARFVAVVVLAGATIAACTERATVPDVDAFLPPIDASRDGAAGSCAVDLDCADRIACTIDDCIEGACEHRACVDCCEGALVCDVSLGCTTPPEPCDADEDCSDAVRCTLDACRDGFCDHRPQSSLCESGEICLAAVGCIPEPPSSCATAEDCAVGARCVGEWDCEVEFGCVFVSTLDCNDGDECTVDACVEDMGGCVHDPRDDDGDGHAPLACAGDDCADDDAARHPGADEVCGDGVDQDCDAAIDEGCCAAGACTTSCGTAGTRTCPPEGDGACAPPAETCDGADQDCDAAIDEGFECTGSGTRACVTSCGSAGTQACAGCAWGACVAPAESCNGADDDCDGAVDDGFACALGSSGACPTACGSTGSRSCTAACGWDLCTPPPEICNGVDDDCDTTCDDGFTCCRGTTRDCSTLGFHAGAAVCSGDCSSWDTSTCTNCGNGTRNPGEACDGADLGGATCTSIGMGFGGGTLGCAAGCMFDTSACSRCGNGTIDAGEQCDATALGGATCASIGMGFTGGMLRCGSGCTYDTGMCTAWNASGTYTTSPAPIYSCAFGIGVNFNGTTMTFSDGGTSLNVTVPGLPCAMTGTFSRATRTIDVSCFVPGSCAETYRLMGAFTGDDVWSATFTASYAGGSCYDCTNRSWSVTGAR
jgi:hypothetical protein